MFTCGIKLYLIRGVIGALNQLPEDASIHERLHNLDVQIMEESFDEGPPQGEEDSDTPGNPLYSRGFVPGINNWENEMDQLRAAALNNNDPVILTLPIIRGTPISEHTGQQIAIDAFPTLFPFGKADFNAPHSSEVTMTGWAAHLI